MTCIVVFHYPQVSFSKAETFTDALALVETSVSGNPEVGLDVHKHFQASYPFAYFSEGASISIKKTEAHTYILFHVTFQAVSFILH